MTANHWLLLWRVETRKLLSRTLGRVGLLVALLPFLFMPLTLHSFGASEMMVNGTPMGEMYSATAPEGLSWSVWTRNFWLIRLFIVALAAQSLAGELVQGTLRDDLMQPVRRGAVVAAKWAALVTWDIIAMSLGVLLGAGLGMGLFGTSDGWTDPLLAAGVSILCDAAIAALALAAATLTRSVAMTLVAVLLALLLDFMTGIALTVAAMVAEVADVPLLLESTLQLRPWLPSSAFNAWSSFGGTDPILWQSYASLALITGGCLAVAVVRFSRTDVH